MLVLTGADLVLPDRVLHAGTLSIADGRIVEIRAEHAGPHASSFAFHGHTIVPGFIDVHVHGVLGTDTLDEGNPVATLAAALPRFGVTAFCPTTTACSPTALRGVLAQVRECREAPRPLAARVLPAHLESNFINPDYRGAQPLACLRTCGRPHGSPAEGADSGVFTAAAILQAIEDHAPDVGIVTLAPELEGALDLIAWLRALGVRVSLGHSGATYDQAVAAIAAGATQATHLFNRMPPLHHREPGLAGAVLQHDDVAAEVICDGAHVHPGMVRALVAAKTAARVMAISDGTAAAGLPPGSTASLGGQRITAGSHVAVLDDGTMAGTVLTMDAAFRRLTAEMGFPLSDAAAMCATTPARQLGLVGHGLIAEGAAADLTVLDREGCVVQTYVGGRLVYARRALEGNSPAAPAV